MIYYRNYVFAMAIVVAALGFVVGCSSVSSVDDGMADIVPSPSQGVDDGITSVEPPPGQDVIDDTINNVPPPVQPGEIPDVGGIPDAGAVNPQPPALGQLFPGQAYQVGKNPVSVKSADLDGDGDLDLAVANLNSNHLSILLSNGDGAFTAAENITTRRGSTSVKAGDLDGDGHVDLVVTFLTSSVISIFLGNGDGTFTAGTDLRFSLVPGAPPRDFDGSLSSSALGILADLDNDGDLDLALPVTRWSGESFTDVVSILLNNGDGTFAAGSDTLGQRMSPITGDLDGDGDIDLVVFLGFGEDVSVSILFNNGDATFSNAGVISGAGGGFLTATGDLDGDGDLDLVRGGETELSDLDGDGDLDMAIIGLPIEVFLNNGDGTFAAATVFSAQPVSDGVFIRDGVTILLNNGDGTFAGDMKYQTREEPTSVTTGDWDGDGDLDLAVANFQTDDVSVLLNNGDGTFLAAVNFAVGGIAYSTGDLDGDGDPDLAAYPSGSSLGASAISISLNNGNGTYTSTSNIAVGVMGTNLIRSGDLDGDGDLDLVATTIVRGGDGFFGLIGAVSIFRNNGDATFAAAENFETGGGASSVAIGDLDGDGDLDLAVGEDGIDGGGVASVLLNNGEGIFSAAVSYPVGDDPLSIDMGDLDGDGDLDLAVANSGEGHGSVSILLNNGNATFAAAVNYGTRTFPKSVVIGDFDGDGYQDLAVGDGNRSVGFVSILLNNGDGTFATRVDYGTGVGKQLFVATGDLDGDGDLDLAVANRHELRDTGSVSVLLNHGDGTFAEAMNFVIVNGFGPVGIGDLDGDGDLDLVVQGGLGVVILFNQLIP